MIHSQPEFSISSYISIPKQLQYNVPSIYLPPDNGLANVSEFVMIVGIGLFSLCFRVVFRNSDEQK